MENVSFFIGADLSKKWIDLAIRPGNHHLKISNAQPGYVEMVNWLKQLQVNLSSVLIVMEYTGLYGFLFERFLHQHGLSYCKVNALEIKRSMGLTRGKTDRIDAHRIAGYAAEKKHKLVLCTPTDERLQRLKLLSTSRAQLVKHRAASKCIVKELQNIGITQKDIVLRSHLNVIKSLDKQIEKLETELETVLQQEEQLAQNYRLLMSIKGVGKIVALAVIVKTGNFTRFRNARKFACFCGIAPFEHSSGSSIKGRTRVSHLADKSMKSLLELVARNAIQFNPEIKAYYERRLAAGKSKQASLNIVRNKIVFRMFAVIARQEPYKLEYAKAA